MDESLTEQNKAALQKVEKDLERKLYSDPGNPDLLKQYAELQNHLGYIENALTLYYQFLSMVPNDVGVMARVGDMHRRLNQFDKCIDILERAYPIDPHNQFIISNLASAYRSKRQYKKSGRFIATRVRVQP